MPFDKDQSYEDNSTYLNVVSVMCSTDNMIRKEKLLDLLGGNNGMLGLSPNETDKYCEEILKSTSDQFMQDLKANPTLTDHIQVLHLVDSKEHYAIAKAVQAVQKSRCYQLIYADTIIKSVGRSMIVGCFVGLIVALAALPSAMTVWVLPVIMAGVVGGALVGAGLCAVHYMRFQVMDPITVTYHTPRNVAPPLDHPLDHVDTALLSQHHDRSMTDQSVLVDQDAMLLRNEEETLGKEKVNGLGSTL